MLKDILFLCRHTCKYWSLGDLSGYDSEPSKSPQLSGNTPSTGTEKGTNSFFLFNDRTTVCV